MSLVLVGDGTFAMTTSNSQAIETTIEEATNHRFLIWDIFGMIWDDSGTLRKIGESKL